MLSVLPSIVILGSVAFVALFLARSRQSPPEAVVQRTDAARSLTVAVGVQGVHFVEEAATNFHELFPALVGLPGMPRSVFIIVNLVWIGIWIASIRGILSGRPAAFFAAWFLALAGMFNGIGHPLMSIAAGGYFPGLMTSPVIGVASVWLWLRLRRATRPNGVLTR